MKKQIFWLFFLFISVKLFSQNFTEEHFKYWYYRERLRYFVYPGIGDGCSVIATYRNPVFALNDLYYSENYKTINYGQTFKSMGYYIGMLATEYKLLVNNGQIIDAQKTLQEIDKALNAIIRMDNCETKEPWLLEENHWDGFFMRTDVPSILSNEMTDYLNANLQNGSYDNYKEMIVNEGLYGLPFKISGDNALTLRKYENSMNYHYQYKLSKDPAFIYHYENKDEEYYQYWKAGGFTSNDEIVGVLMGLALVGKLVDDAAILDKVREISSRMTKFALLHPACSNSYGYDISDLDNTFQCIPFQMRYPTLEAISSGNGGISIGVIYGLDGANQKITGSDSFLSWYLNFVSSLNNLSVSTKSIYKIIVTALSTINGTVQINLPNNNYTIIHNYDRSMFSKLIATSDMTGSILTPSYALRTIGNENEWESFYMPLWAVINDKDLTKNTYNYPFSLLIEQLSSAPCGGPFHYSFSYNGVVYDTCSQGWSNQYKFDAAIQAQYAGDENNFGVFSGADYMLLYNLACLAFPNGFDYEGQHYSFPPYVNQNNRSISAYYPMLYPLGGGIEYGSTANPEEIKAISTIETDMVVSNEALFPSNSHYIPGYNGDVTLKAGESIKLTDGFRVDAGAHFLARIESYSCGGVSYKNMAAPPWDENHRGCYYDTLISVPMEKRAPIVYSEDNYEDEEFDMPLWEDYYYMNDTTAAAELAVGAWLNPNPCGSSVTLTVVSENEQQLTIELYDMAGIKRETFFNDIADQNLVLNLNLSSYASGTYMLRISGAGGMKVLRFVKE